MWPFKSKPETAEEIAAEEKLDEVTREVASEEFQKEADRELSTGRLGPDFWLGHFRKFRWKKGDPVPEPVDDPDPGDERGLRDALREGEREYEERHPGEKR